MSLKDSDGIMKTKHEDKAEILWQTFRERLGTSEFSQMHFNLKWQTYRKQTSWRI
jgi:hypothetical protein